MPSTLETSKSPRPLSNTMLPKLTPLVFQLDTKGVNFGSIVFDSGLGDFDVSNVEGIEHDLVVRPFGRKGEFATVRGFDVGAMMFHFGMQPVEDPTVGPGFDADGDGVVDEILIGEMSALHIFNTNLEPPEIRKDNPNFLPGSRHFDRLGCSDCHKPFLDTDSPFLTYSFPEVEEDPSANVFMMVDMRTAPTSFATAPTSLGVRVPLFSDLKRHNMGPGLAETFQGAPNQQFNEEFITPRLWGIADTAPYLHDGRALTLTEAITAHGGEAQQARDDFVNSSDQVKIELLDFLRTLRTPKNPGADLLP